MISLFYKDINEDSARSSGTQLVNERVKFNPNFSGSRASFFPQRGTRKLKDCPSQPNQLRKGN